MDPVDMDRCSTAKLDWHELASHVERINEVHLHKIALQKLNCCRGTTFSYIKSKQLEAIKHLLEQQDVIGLLPTGYGKSLIFELLPYLVKDVLIIVVSPLNALIHQQISKLHESACRATEFVKNPTVSFIIDHPEQFLIPTTLDEIRKICRRRPVYLVIDEVHCIIQWGPSFRPDYRHLYELKAVARGVTVLALTATATIEARLAIEKNLALKSPKLVQTTGDRPNIKFIIKQRLTNNGPDGVEGSYEKVFTPILESLVEEQDSFPKTILYTNLKWVGIGMEEALRDRRDGSPSKISHLVVQYHKPATEEAKCRVAKVFRTGEARLMFATEAYSMGTDVPDVRQIIHAGPPKNMETLYQEIGRAGRDGEPAEAILYYNASDIAVPKKDDVGEQSGTKPNNRYVSKDIRLYCTTQGCRRQVLGDHFDFDIHRPNKAHNCCDNCELTCTCDATTDFSECIRRGQINVKMQRTPLQEALSLYFECEGSDASLNEDLITSLCHCQTQEEVHSCLTDNDIDQYYQKNIIHLITHLSSIPICDVEDINPIDNF